MNVIAELETLLQVGNLIRDAEPRTLYTEVACQFRHPDPDTMNGVPCRWVGSAILTAWFDTKEILWNCPECGMENSELFTDYYPVTGVPESLNSQEGPNG